VTVIDCAQRSPEWHAARLGKFTASNAAEMLSKGRKAGDESTGRRNLRVRLALERLTGRAQGGGFQSQAMLDGIEREADALGAYEAQTGVLLSPPVGFVAHDELMAGCSPDGVVLDGQRIVGGVETKCPTAPIHWEYVQAGTVPEDYRKQIIHTLWLTGADWWDFASWSPEFVGVLEPLQLLVVRVPRVEHEMASYEIEARAFLTQVDRTLAEMQAAAKGAAA